MFMMSSLFSKTSTMTTPSTGQSKMHQMQQKHPDRLPDEQRHVLFSLSPMYQRIYLYALDDDQREMVAVFESRGENPYKAIDSILTRDRRMADPTMRNKCAPCNKSKVQKQQRSYMISQKEKAVHKEDNVWADSSDDYEFYDENETSAYNKGHGYKEKPDYKSYRSQEEQSPKRSCKSFICKSCNQSMSSESESCGCNKGPTKAERSMNKSSEHRSNKESCKSCSKESSSCDTKKSWFSRKSKKEDSDKMSSKKEGGSWFSKSKKSTSSKKSNDSNSEYKVYHGKKKYEYKETYSKKKRCGCQSRSCSN